MFLLKPLAFVLAILSFPVAVAQAPAPAQPAASGPPPSAFEGYRRFEDQPTAPWRQSNDTARDVGGWRAYAREVHSGKAAPAAAPAASAASNPHAGHH